MRSIAKKLALLLPVAALVSAFLVIVAPSKARAEEVNQCAGTVTETGNDLIPAKNIIFYPSLDNNGATPEGDFSASWPVGPISIKVTAADGIKKGDYVTISAKDKTSIRNVITGISPISQAEK